MFGSLGTPELLILLAIVLVIFGASRLPRLGRGLGEGIRNFRRGLQSEERHGDAVPPDPVAEDQKSRGSS